MQVAAQALNVVQERKAAVAATVAKIRQIEREQGVTRPALEQIKVLMLALSAHKELFPKEDFPLPDGQTVIYRLAEDGDHRFAMYMSCGNSIKKVPPHNHTTWAVITAVEGEEENFFYERSDDGQVPGRGTLKQVSQEVVREGVGVSLLPEDIHHIQTHGYTQHLHMYGRSLEHIPNRVRYNVEDGTYKVYGVNPNIVYMS